MQVIKVVALSTLGRDWRLPSKNWLIMHNNTIFLTLLLLLYIAYEASTTNSHSIHTWLLEDVEKFSNEMGYNDDRNEDSEVLEHPESLAEDIDDEFDQDEGNEDDNEIINDTEDLYDLGSSW